MDTTHTSSLPPTFIFPVLKPGDILQCMHELGIDMSKSELTEPARHKEKLRKVFVNLLEICAGKTEEDLQVNSAGLEKAATALPFPDLHAQENFNELAFFEALRNLFVVCGYHEFSWRDLYAPEPKRLRHQLSAILNLAKFREEQLKLYAALSEPRAEFIATIENLNHENMELNRQLDITEKESQSKFQEMEEVVRECQELELEIARNNRLQSTAREEAAAFKKKANDLKDELATSVWALQEAEAEEERLRLQVVSSPDRRKAEMVHRRERLDKVKQECAILERELQDSKAKILNVKQISKDFDSINSTLDELQVQATKYADVIKQLEETQEKIQASEKYTSEYAKATEQAERELHRMEEKIVHQRRQHKMQMDAMQEALEVAKAQLLAVEKDRRDGMARVEAGEAEVKKLEADMEHEKIKTAQEIQAMIREYQETEKLFLERNAERMALIEA